MSSIEFSPKVQDLIEQVASAVQRDTPLFLVGGAIRDRLLGLEVHDLDFCIPEDGIRVGRQVAIALSSDFYPLDKARDTGRVILQRSGQERVTIDISSWRGPDLESDLHDRDFTINAIAQNVHTPERLIDPLGGINDLHKRVLRPCSPEGFINDPLRSLRAVRFAIQLGLKISDNTKRDLKEALPGLEDISPERMRDELFRIFECSKPASALRLLDVLEILPYVLPEAEKMKAVKQSPPHTLDVWEHSLATVQKLSDVLHTLGSNFNPEEEGNWITGLVSGRLGRFRSHLDEHLGLRINPDRSLRGLLVLAAFYHDIGKPQSQTHRADERIHFYNHEFIGAELLAARAKFLRLSTDEVSRLVVILQNHMQPSQLARNEGLPSRRAIFRFFKKTKAAGIDVCLLSMADRLAAYGTELPQDVWIHHIDVVRELLESWWEHHQEKVSPPALLNGDTLINTFGLKPGPLIGEILAALSEAQAVGEICSVDDAYCFVNRYIDQG